MTEDTIQKGIIVTEDEEPTELTYEEAVALTNSLRSAGDLVWVLAYQAYEHKVWKTLGYNNFVEYAEQELQSSKSSVYRLLAQGEVLLELSKILPEGVTPPKLSQSAAIEIREVLPQLTDEVERICDVEDDPEEVSRQITEAIANYREELKAEKDKSKGVDAGVKTDFVERAGPFGLNEGEGEGSAPGGDKSAPKGGGKKHPSDGGSETTTTQNTDFGVALHGDDFTPEDFAAITGRKLTPIEALDVLVKPITKEYLHDPVATARALDKVDGENKFETADKIREVRDWCEKFLEAWDSPQTA